MTWKSALIGCVCLCLAPAAFGQPQEEDATRIRPDRRSVAEQQREHAAEQRKFAAEQRRHAADLREHAAARCKQNRGVDCDSTAGLDEWIRQERPISAEEQAAAAGARRKREACQKNKNAAGC